MTIKVPSYVRICSLLDKVIIIHNLLLVLPWPYCNCMASGMVVPGKLEEGIDGENINLDDNLESLDEVTSHTSIF